MARRRKPTPKFLKRGDEYLYLTGECPKGFEDALFVAWSGIPATESVEPSDRLKGAKEVEADAVPDDFYESLVLADVCEPRETVISTEPDPEPEPKPKPRRRKPEPDPDVDQEAIFDVLLASGLDVPTSMAASGYYWDDEPRRPKPRKKPKVNIRAEVAAANLRCVAVIAFVIIMMWLCW